MPDAGAPDPADGGRASAAAVAGLGALAQAGRSPAVASAPEGDAGVVDARPAPAARGRIIRGASTPPVADPQPADPGAPVAEARVPETALSRRLAALERSRSDEEVTLRQVDRFVPTGGITLTGRVVDADGGKPIAGSVVHVHHEGTLVEGNTDAAGSFKLPGMVAGSHVVVWVGHTGDPYIDERLELTVSVDGETADAGTLKLLRGDELAGRLEGWVGLFINRRASQIVVAGISPWTPADEAHLETGDQIVSIDGRDMAGLGPRAVTYLLRGRVGTSVALVVREHGGQRRKLTLARVVR